MRITFLLSMTFHNHLPSSPTAILATGRHSTSLASHRGPEDPKRRELAVTAVGACRPRGLHTPSAGDRRRAVRRPGGRAPGHRPARAHASRFPVSQVRIFSCRRIPEFSLIFLCVSLM